MQNIIKGITDIILSILILILFSPFLLFITIAIKIDDPGPIFFRQERVGKDGRLFRIFKFRTMVVGAEKKGAGIFVEEDDPRITRVGRLLRHFSIDELAQLFNVVKGEMSLVGPRPTLLYQVERYDERQRQRLNMKPGMTGWAQVNGRNELTWPERIELDLWYIKNWSLALDLKIVLKTIVVVLQKKNLYKKVNYDPISGKMEKVDEPVDHERKV